MHLKIVLTFALPFLAIPLSLSSPLSSSLTWTTYLNPAIPVFDPPNNYTFSPTTLTLIQGPHSAILIDSPLSIASAETVSAWVTSQIGNKTLKYIYITHGHGDHFFGLPIILEHFPNTTVIATKDTIAHAQEQIEPAVFNANWGPFFPGQIAPQTELETWTALPTDGVFDLDGFRMQAIEVGQTDTYNTTVLHVPSLKMVVTGDAVYGSCFQYLQETDTPALRAEWLKALVEIEKLEPEIVIPSHRQEWDDFSIENLARTREYLRGWEIELLESGSKDDFKTRLADVFPERIGDFIFERSAEAAFPGNGTA